MKKFEDILKTTQPELKAYLKRYLISKKYEVIEDDGFLYAKGTVPVLLVAHMDRHPMQDVRVKTIKKETKDNKEIWSSPEGICGDDRAGCYAVMNIVNESHCSVLFCEDEEKGSIGAGKFCKTQYINNLDVNYMIQIDRRGSHDLVFYTNDNRDFVKWLEKNTDFKEAYGSFTDICKLMPASGIAGVNFSTGYYDEHSHKETIVIEELNHTIETIKKLVKIKVKEPFKYVEKKYEWGTGWSNWNLPYDVKPAKSKPKRYTSIENNTGYSDYELEELVLTITTFDEETETDETIQVTGRTKQECWFRAFTKETWLSFDKIIDFEFT